MYLKQILLRNFRNYRNQEICFHPGINVFQGMNAQGKSNLLEAIYYLAVSRSFRTNTEEEMVRWEDRFFYLKGTFYKDHEQSCVEIGYEQPKRLQIKLDGVVTKRGDYLQRYPVVVFSPDDLLLIKEGPTGRRRFLNLEGSRLKPLYYTRLRDYHRTLQQRNRILKEKKNYASGHDLLEPWDRAIVEIGSKIIRQRISLLQALEEQARLFFRDLTASSENLSVKYVSSVDFKANEDQLEQIFNQQLKTARGLEFKRGYTVLGPHLDDFMILIDGYEAKRYASQGQQRTASLALKMGEVNLFCLSFREEPVVLLDDVFSEFDQERRKQLLTFLQNREGQSFITTALPLGEIIDGLGDGMQIFSVYKGKITVEGTGSNH